MSNCVKDVFLQALHVKNTCKFSYLSLFLFYCMYICKFRTQYGMDLIQATNKDYWRNFGIFRVFFVSLQHLSHAFLEVDVRVFEKYIFFNIQQVVFRVR